MVTRAFLQPIITLLRCMWFCLNRTRMNQMMMLCVPVARRIMFWNLRCGGPRVLAYLCPHHAPQVANVVSGSRTTLHVAPSDLYKSIPGRWPASKFAGDLGWSSFALGSLGACSAASGAHCNRHKHVDVQSRTQPLWRGTLDVGQDISWSVTQVFARQFECFDLLSELVRMVQWHAWPVVAPTCCSDLRPWAGRLCRITSSKTH